MASAFPAACGGELQFTTKNPGTGLGLAIVHKILMDARMAQMGGIGALEKIKACNPSIPIIIIMTAYSSVESAVGALKAENILLKSKLGTDFDLANIIGRSKAIKALIDRLAMAAPSEATVLITIGVSAARRYAKGEIDQAEYETKRRGPGA